VAPPPGVELRAVLGKQDVEALVSVHDEVFGEDHSALGRALLADLAHQPGEVAAVVAWAGQTAIAAGRVEFHSGTDFASLWGGGTLPAWRGRGVFRTLVAHRAALASARGFRYLQVDASPDSRPILQRLGFVELATTTPFTHPGGAG
jgi:GNAT superfamily N-acetyltransferase